MRTEGRLGGAKLIGFVGSSHMWRRLGAPRSGVSVGASVGAVVGVGGCSGWQQRRALFIFEQTERVQSGTVRPTVRPLPCSQVWWVGSFIVRLFLRAGSLTMAQRGVSWALCTVYEGLRREQLAQRAAVVSDAIGRITGDAQPFQRPVTSFLKVSAELRLQQPQPALSDNGPLPREAVWHTSAATFLMA